MRRALVIGSGGAGKSTLAARLAERTGLPLIHLDALYWSAGWTEPSKEEWAHKVGELTSGAQWIMDGNYGGTLDRRLAACDTAIFLDLPRILCLWRVLSRRVRFHGRARPDMLEGCPERLTWQFIRWIWSYPVERRPKILQRLSSLRPDQRAIILRSTPEVEDFLRSIPPQRSPC
jgi:adenylate kinase family enzyme